MNEHNLVHGVSLGIVGTTYCSTMHFEEDTAGTLLSFYLLLFLTSLVASDRTFNINKVGHLRLFGGLISGGTLCIGLFEEQIG